MSDEMVGKGLLPGMVVSVAGLGLFFLDTGIEFAGPQLPDTALGYVGWAIFLVGLGLLKLAAPR